MICCRMYADSLAVINFTNRAKPDDYWGGTLSELPDDQAAKIEKAWQDLIVSLCNNESRFDIAKSGNEYKILAIDKESAYEAIGRVVMGRFNQVRGKREGI